MCLAIHHRRILWSRGCFMLGVRLAGQMEEWMPMYQPYSPLWVRDATGEEPSTNHHRTARAWARDTLQKVQRKTWRDKKSIQSSHLALPHLTRSCRNDARAFAISAMTKAIPPRRRLPTSYEGNQKDDFEQNCHSFSKQQPPDWDEEDTLFSSDDACKPTALQELLELELDLGRPTISASASMSIRNHLMTPAVSKDELKLNVGAVSLELLAMQSPHGESQQWQNEAEEQDMAFTPSTAPARPEYSPPRKAEEVLAPRKPMPLDLISPTSFNPSLPLSPTRSSTDYAYGLASPMTLPDTPSQSRLGIDLTWDFEPTCTLQSVNPRKRTSHRAQSKSVQKPERRASSDSVAARAVTPSPQSYKNYIPGRARITRSSLPALPEVRGKTRHGGIYSLLLKNTSVKQEPVLVEDTHNPEGSLKATSVSKVSPPRTFNKQTHGGIYKMLRASHESR